MTKELTEPKNEKTPWSDKDRRLLVITVAGTLAANLATVLIVFVSLAIIKAVERCPADFAGGCPQFREEPIWSRVWWLTAAGVVGLVIIFIARQVHRHAPEKTQKRARFVGLTAAGVVAVTILIWIGLASGLRA
jgi:hypothetical protein